MKQCQICKSQDLNCFIGHNPNKRFYICNACNDIYKLNPEQMWIPIQCEEEVDREWHEIKKKSSTSNIL